MKSILILGANGQLAHNTTARFLETRSGEQVNLKLCLRRSSQLANPWGYTAKCLDIATE